MNRTFIKSIAGILVAVMLLSCLFACGKDPEPNPDEGTGTESSAPTDSTPSSEPAGSDSTPDTEGAPMNYELKKFTIIRASSGTDLTTSAALSLYNLMKANGFRLDRPVEDVNKDEQDGEILVGLTNRAASSAVAGKLTEDNQFLISFRKGKIVILAKKEMVLAQAVQYFLTNYAMNAVNGILTVNENHTYIGTTNLVEMASGGVVKYSVVYSFSDGDEVISSANILAERLKSRAKSEVAVTCTDDFEDYGADDFLILVGNVNSEKYPDVSEMKKGWSFPEYGVRIKDNRIYVIGNFPELINKAVLMMVDLVTNASELVDGKLTVSIPDHYSEVAEEYLADYPEFDGTVTECYKATGNELVFRYTGINTEAYEAYIAKLGEAGYDDVYGEHTIGRTRFTTCLNEEKGQVHVSFYPAANGIGELQVITSKLEDTVAIPRETYDPATQKVTDTTLHVMSLDYSTGAYASSKRLCDGSGMSFVVTLEDGRYVVFDGGYTDNDGKNLAEYLKAENKRTDDKVVIAAWFISHPHDDHFGGYQAFVLKYSQGIEIQYMVVNAPTNERYGDSNWMTGTMPGLIATTGAKLIKPHTGQVLTFCNTEFEIVYTHENLGSGGWNDGNNTSTVVRMFENGHSTLFTGDASVAACNKMVSLYGDALQSDIHQTNHHGVSGGTLEFYQKVNAKIVLWTTSQDSFAGHDDPSANCGYSGCVGRTGRINGGGNSAGNAEQVSCNLWVRDNVGIENCYVADDVIEWITFPEGGAIAVNTETGYFVDNRVGTYENEGLLQMPADPVA